jgi:hypothetical protein
VRKEKLVQLVRKEFKATQDLLVQLVRKEPEL